MTKADKSERLGGPLGRALKKRLGNEDNPFDASIDSIDSFIDKAPFSEKTTDACMSYRLALRAATNWYKHLKCHQLEEVTRLCESPLEDVMLAALITTAVGFDITINLSIPGRKIRFCTCDYDGNLTITPQASLGDYRVDFLIEYEEIVPDFENPVVHRGVEIPGSRNIRIQLIVECDGHDFHEKTKEQVRNDKKRDRILQSFGYQIFRFAGSEIWRDPVKCAQEVLDHLTQESWPA